MEETEQSKIWRGEFGKDYTDRNFRDADDVDELWRNDVGVGRREMNTEFLDSLDRSLKILEVGSNSGNQLILLEEMGFTNLHGLEVQPYAIERAKKRLPQVQFTEGTAIDMPFEDNSFDLVFTSGVLIHIAPEDIERALGEICRCSQSYVWGYEFYEETLVNIPYREHDNLHWKGDYVGLYKKLCPSLEVLKQKIYQHKNSSNQDVMYLIDLQKEEG